MFGDERQKVNRLVARIQKGDMHAFSLLFDLTNGKLTFYARHYLRDKQYAEDVVNETYLRFCSNIDLLDSNDNMLGWLITVTKRIARLYPQFKEGDTLTEEFIEQLSPEDQEAADQINRRTEFQVLSLTYNMD